jgi:hypothetical protein
VSVSQNFSGNISSLSHVEKTSEREKGREMREKKDRKIMKKTKRVRV